ncbi:MAG: hypothetical protein RIT43_1770 [Bacteroidota bacterium]|jgi:hypothetical protein
MIYIELKFYYLCTPFFVKINLDVKNERSIETCRLK